MKKINSLIIALISIVLFVSCGCNQKQYHYKYLIEIRYSNDSQDEITYEVTSHDVILRLEAADHGGLFSSANNVICLKAWADNGGAVYVPENIACDVKNYKIIKYEKTEIDSKHYNE